jgi:hypothetical protein
MSKWNKVVSCARSPLNAQRWLVRLECGHETWITSARKPKIGECPTCPRTPVRVVKEKTP